MWEERTPRFWLHEISAKRNNYGEINQAFNYLTWDDDKLFKDMSKFFQLADILSPQKRKSNFGDAVSPVGRLAKTLKQAFLFPHLHLGLKGCLAKMYVESS
jgi:hypothetical protein